MIAVRHAEPSDIPTLIEVTSGERRRDAHALYRAFGFAEKRSRFVKKLAG